MLQRFLSLVFRNFQLQRTVVALHLRCSIILCLPDYLNLINILSTTQRLQSDAGSPKQKYQCQPMDPPAKTGDPAESSGRFGFCWKGMNRWQIFGGMDEGKQHAREMVNKISHGSASLPESTIEGCDVDAKNRTGSNILSRMVNDCFHIPKR